MLFEKAFEPAKRFLGVIGASVGGLTAIFYIFGFLAMQAHHSFLGLTHISVDFNQYLFSGGLFFAYFPSLVIYFWDGLLEIAARDFEWLLYGIGAIIVISLLLRIPLFRRLLNSLGNLSNKLAIRSVTGLQILFNLLLLWLFLSFSLKLVQQNNWLFEGTNPDYSWLIDATTAGSSQRQAYFAGLFGMAILSVLVMTLLEKWRRHPNAKTGKPVKAPWRSVLSVSAALLLILQLLYLPVNYGILIVSRNYPIAEFGLHKAQLKNLTSLQQPLILIHREGEDYFFYSREQKKIWQIKRAELAWLTRTGEVNIFAPYPLQTYKGGNQ